MKNNNLKSSLPWVVSLVLIVGGIYWGVTTSEKAEENRLGESIAIVNRDHISVGDVHSGYNSNPPTSGPHAGPAPWGFNFEEILDENAVHNLEHGGIWISYKDIDEAAIAQLQSIAASNNASVLVSPRASNDSKIAIASWGRLLKAETVDESVIAEFIRQNKNKSPEPLAR